MHSLIQRAAVGTAALALVAGLSAGAVVGCRSCGGESPLDGTGWVLQGWSISSLYPGDFEITASFDDGQISGKAAVNTYTGPYSTDSNGTFEVGEITRTLMAGSEPAMRAEDLFLELLKEARGFRLEGGQLLLLDANGNELLVFTGESP